MITNSFNDEFSLQSKTIDVFTKLNPIHNKIKLLFHAIRIEISQILMIEDALEIFEVQLKSTNSDLEAYKNFIKNHEIDTVKIADTIFSSTICQNCNVVCHENCEPDEMVVINDEVIHQCWVMKNGYCRQCPNKCSHSVHYNAQKTIKKIKKILQDMLKDFGIKCGEITDKDNNKYLEIKSQEDMRKILDRTLKLKNDELNQFCIRLYQFHMTIDLTQQLQLTIDQLDKDCTLLKSGHAKKRVCAFISSLNSHRMRMVNEPDLMTKVLWRKINGNTIEIKKDIDQSGYQSLRTKKIEERQLLPSFEDIELEELLVDQLLQSRTAAYSGTFLEIDKLLISSKSIRNNVKSLLHTMRIDVGQLLIVQDEIQVFVCQSNNGTVDLKTYENFMKNFKINTVQIVETTFTNTICQNCNVLCHENCEPDEMTVINDEVIHQCWIMKNGYCRQCPNKCSHSVHYRAKKMLQMTRKKLVDALKDIQRQYSETAEYKTTNHLKIITKDEAKNILNIALEHKEDEIKHLCTRLYQICTNTAVTEELNLYIAQLEVDMNALRSIDLKKHANSLIRKLKDICGKMVSNSNFLTKALLELSANLTPDLGKNEDYCKLNEEHMTNENKAATITDMKCTEIVLMLEKAESENSIHAQLLPESEESPKESKQEVLDTSEMAKVLVIGETGSGKSTFINYLTNYFYDGNLEKLHVVIPSKFYPNVTERFTYCENDIQNITQSKTDSCNQYMFFKDSKQYVFVDTPGLSDTRGTLQDDTNIAKIIDAVENLGGLTAVVIVVNGTVSRLTINLRNVLARLRGNLPDTIMNNIIVVLTNVTRYAANFSIPALELNGNVYPYYMQNSAFSQDPKTWSTAAFEAIQQDFGQSMIEIQCMIGTIDTFKTQSVTAFQTMKIIRNQIKTLLHKTRLEISQIQGLQDEISIFENFIKQCDCELPKYEDYTKEREVDTIELVDASVNSTLCQQCNQICHENCQLDESTTIGAQIFQQCWVMENGYCQQCTGKCSYSVHYLAKKAMKKCKKKVKDILLDIKDKYDRTAEEKNTYQLKLASKEGDRKLLENALRHKNEEIKRHCLNLRRICTGFDITQELYALIHQLEVEETLLRSIEAKQQTSALLRSLKDLCNIMANDPELASKVPIEMNIIHTEPPADRQINRAYKKSTDRNLAEETLSSSQTNPISSAPECYSKSESYANDDVIAIIRDISSKKTLQSHIRKNLKGKRSEESLSGINDNNEKISSPVPQSKTAQSKDLRTFSTDELISLYNSGEELIETNLLIFELVQRSLGKSMGPIKTPQAIDEFTRSTQKYSLTGMNELMKEYERLKSFINSIVGSDIFKIIQVPPNILSDIAIVYMLLQAESLKASSTFNTYLYQMHPYNNISPTYSVHSSSSPCVLPTENFTHMSPQPDSTINQNINSIPAYASYVYESTANSQIYCHLQSNVSNSTLEHNVCKDSLAQNNQTQNIPDSVLQTADQPFPEVLSQQQNTSKYTQPHFVTNSSAENSHPSLQKPYMADSEPNNHNCSQYKATTTDDNSTGIANMANTFLISRFKDACAKHDKEQSNLYYNELKRRCYGNYPLLINKERALFDELCRSNEGQTVEELEQSLLRITESIDIYLVDGDPTRIHTIPKQLLFEAAVIHYLIASKTSKPKSMDS